MTQVSAALLFLHKYLQNYSNIYIYFITYYITKLLKQIFCMWNYFWIYRAFNFIGANLSTTKTWLKFHNPM